MKPSKVNGAQGSAVVVAADGKTSRFLQIQSDSARFGLRHSSLPAQVPRELGKTREAFHLYNNMWDRDLHLDSFIGGEKYHQILARTDGHGRWFQWLQPQNKENRNPG